MGVRPREANLLTKGGESWGGLRWREFDTEEGGIGVNEYMIRWKICHDNVLDWYFHGCQDFFDHPRWIVSPENSRNRSQIAPVLNASFVFGLKYCNAMGVDLAYSKGN